MKQKLQAEQLLSAQVVVFLLLEEEQEAVVFAISQLAAETKNQTRNSTGGVAEGGGGAFEAEAALLDCVGGYSFSQKYNYRWSTRPRRRWGRWLVWWWGWLVWLSLRMVSPSYTVL